ncbi:MAG: PAS domain S-box protein [Deltaproteobacteria bacterium]|nr:PAS domain S-box protein [Deltaproteobacteria bacterium]
MADDRTNGKQGPQKGEVPEGPIGSPQSAGKSKIDRQARLSDERYRSFIENIREGVYEVDIDGNFLYFNNSLCTVFGYPREEIQWQNFSKFMDEEHARAAFEIFNKIYRTGEGISDLVWRIVDKDGQERIIELSASLITNPEGEKIGFRGIARDVTEKYRAQEALRESEYRYQCQYEASRAAEKRYRTLLEFVPYPMVVFAMDDTVTYLNPAFTETFGWTLEELRGKPIPYFPDDLAQESRKDFLKRFEEDHLSRYESKRLTKDGRVLDVVIKETLFSEDGRGPTGKLVILRDITQEKRVTSMSEAMIRISMALPEYPDLEDLLNYISGEIKRLLNAEGAMVILLDEEKNELFFRAGAYLDQDTQRRAREIRYPANTGVAGRVIQTGRPAIVLDTSKDPDFNPAVDRRLGTHARNMLMVPLRSSDRIIGVLCAINKGEGVFESQDQELLNMIAGTVALSVENARFAKEITEAYNEVTSLNRAKDRVINHLSHELKTPVSILMGSLNILRKRLEALPEKDWKVTLERAHRNLNRILEIQYQVEDIMQEKHFKTHALLSLLLQQCRDELEVLVAEEVGEGDIVERIHKRIEELFGTKESKVRELSLNKFVGDRVEQLKEQFLHRKVEINVELEDTPSICIPEDVLGKIVDGMVKNAVEATPDSGKIEITVRKRGRGAEFEVKDYGIGITEENQRRIFEGFFMTQETMEYSSKRPFDFNAGGKGADLLRMKIFAERYHFDLDMESSRCRYIPREQDHCPGKIEECPFCKTREDCYQSGGSKFKVFFPPAPVEGCDKKESSGEDKGKERDGAFSA